MSPPPVAGARPVTNVRNLTSPFWRSALTTPANRCLVPVTAFAEWTAEKSLFSINHFRACSTRSSSLVGSALDKVRHCDMSDMLITLQR